MVGETRSVNPKPRSYFGWTTNLTFQEVAQTAQKIAGQIAALGDNNSRVAVIMTNSLQGYLVIMGLQQLGKTIVFINRRLSVAEINYQLADAGVSLLSVSYTHLTLPTICSV